MRATKNKFVPAFVFIFSFLSPAVHPLSLSLDPTFRETGVASKTFASREEYLLSRFALSLKPSGIRGDFWRVEADLEILAFGGDYLSTDEWRTLVLPLLEGRPAVEWSKLFLSANDLDIRGRAYRLYGAVDGGPFEFSLGRMRNAFGNTRIFLSPLDRFDGLPTPVSEPLERPGSDTAKLKVSGPGGWRFQGAYLWDQRNRLYRSFIQGQGLLREGLEAGLMAGQLAPRTRGMGAGLGLNVFEGQLRWEGTYNEKKEEKFSLEIVNFMPVLKIETVTRVFKRHLVHWERAYAGDWVFAAEYLHNGSGESRSENYDVLRLLLGDDLYLGRDYIGAVLSHTVSATWAWTLEGLANAKDGSFAWYPELRRLSADSSIEAKLRFSGYAGPQSGEFRRLPDRLQLLVSWYF
ncbi:MAG: hypothetical protein HYT79_08060 [Elusimicrobia bacterium]|nr:hypothetical protein [Elusimicrobiota bacterium]